MRQINRIKDGLVNQKKSISFTFNGHILTGYEGDTLASALLANNKKLVGRSFKYHRPRVWFISPFPGRGQGLKFVIGKPVEPSTNCFGLVPTEEQVDEYHERFYQATKRLFNEHKGTFAGYEDIEAVLVSSNK